MRRVRAAALAAALAVAALAGGCKPSSLTPFGIGRKEPQTDTGAGVWRGVNTTGGEVEFSVVDNEVMAVTVIHLVPGCRWPQRTGDVSAVIDGNSFSLEVFYDPSGRFVFSGTFDSPDTASGSYFYEGRPSAPPCESSGSGSYVASRLR